MRIKKRPNSIKPFGRMKMYYCFWTELFHVDCRNYPYYNLRAAAKAALSYAFLFLLPVNGSTYSLKLSESVAISSCSWLRIYSAIAVLFQPTVST